MIKTNFDVDFNLNKNDIEVLLIAKVDDSLKWQKKNKKAKFNHVAKNAKMSDEIFDYVHVSLCQRWFLLIWYNDLIYTSK